MSKSLFRNIIAKLILNIFNICVPLIVSPYILRVIGIENIGKINYAESIYTYFFAFASMGIYQYGVREVSKLKQNKDKLESFFTSCFIISLIGSISILIIYFSFIISSSNVSSFKFILFIYGINIFSNVFYVEWANEGFENYNFITIKTITLRIIYIIGIFLFVKKSSDFLNYIIINSLFMFFNNLFSFIVIKKKIKFNFKKIRIKKHIKYLLAGFIISNWGIFFYQVDKTSLGLYIGDLEVSIYSVSNIITFMLITLIQTLVTVSIPRLTNHVYEDKGKYINLLNKIYKVYLMITFPVSIGVFILSKEILFLYGGKEYLNASTTLRIFCIFMIISNIEIFIRNQILYVNNKEKFISILLICFSISNIIFDFIILPKLYFNSNIAILKTTILILLLLICEVFYIKKIMKFKFFIVNKSILIYFISSVSFIIVNWIIKIIVINTFIQFVLTIIICFIYYLIILIIFKDEFLKKLINKAKQ
ncbi:TPA: oligosaccharide flippase family protein [Clostridium perfringens]|uniref:Oligosaccharide flippase family protein n=1 Tax=Clostridium perfringens TaxID=1502 RepID=A0A8H9UXV0_CLOPF|nr:oligosaccharide flippase family protein [Clostridium perfringens]